MILDFMNGTGRFDPDMGDEPMYSRRDVEKGLIYAEGWMEEGLEVEPFYKFKLSDLARWCRDKLKNI